MSDLYTAKAEKYARYRWDCAPAALSALLDLAGVSDQTVVADLGAGTGILTRHLLGKAKMVYAVEPEAGMRFWLEKACSESPFCQIINSSAEKTGFNRASSHFSSLTSDLHLWTFFSHLSARPLNIKPS
jgi:16S rRNA A1518/A1519 N6-dimethyltransferase RsmA/KsgA/DIM1 with predicted DNA glycosylase/AP lyase activity